MMITKKDWEIVLKNNQDDKDRMIKAYELSLPQFDMMIEFCKKKIAEFPEEDPMPEGVKDIVDALK